MNVRIQTLDPPHYFKGIAIVLNLKLFRMDSIQFVSCTKYHWNYTHSIVEYQTKFMLKHVLFIRNIHKKLQQ